MNKSHGPRAFGSVAVCAVYVPTNGNAARALSINNYSIHQAPVFILGDFNYFKLQLSLPGFEHYVKCETRDDRALDMCNRNIKNARDARFK